MYISLTNTIGAIRTAVGIIRKNLQLWLDFNKSEVIGSELVDNGDFATESDWNLGTGWSYGDNEAVFTGTSTGAVANWLRQYNVTNIGGRYRVGFDIETEDLGIVGKLTDGWATYIDMDNGSGHYEVDFTPLATEISFTVVTNKSYSITNISVKEVTQFVKDKSPNTNNAKLFTGKALSFNGNDQIDLGSQSATSDITIAMWLNLDDLSGSKCPLTIGEALVKVSNSDIEWYPNENSTQAIFAGVMTVGWQRIVITQTSTSCSLYINGLLIESKAAVVIDTAPKNSYIGSYGPSTWFFEGGISDLQIYNKAWTADDVAYDYNNPNLLAIDNPATSLIVTDLKGYWALNEGDGLVAYDSGSTLEEDVVQNGDFSELGSESVVNGDFSDGVTGWVAPSGWAASGSSIVSSSGNGSLTQDVNVVAGETYLISINILTFTSGTLYVDLGGSSAQTYTTYGVKSFYLTTTSTGLLRFYGGAFLGSITNISVKQVDPNNRWNLGPGWNYGDDKAVSDGTTSNLFQVLEDGNVIGRTYQISLLVSNYTSGYLSTSVGGYDYSTTQVSSNGAHTVIVKVTNASSNDRVYLSSSLFNGSITNISVTEITQSAHGSNTTTSGDLIGATYVDKQDTIPQLGMMDWRRGVI